MAIVTTGGLLSLLHVLQMPVAYHPPSTPLGADTRWALAIDTEAGLPPPPPPWAQRSGLPSPPLPLPQHTLGWPCCTQSASQQGRTPMALLAGPGGGGAGPPPAKIIRFNFIYFRIIVLV